MEPVEVGSGSAGRGCPTSDELAAFVDGARSHEIELHLDACASCRRAASAMVEDGGDEGESESESEGEGDGDGQGDRRSLAETVPARPGGAGAPRRRAPASAARYGRFELTHTLGEGAMGQVWAARDPGLGRDVALKIMALPVALSAEGAERMRREAQAMARLSHPNVVRIYELGTEGDQVFCAMELVDGETWRQWLETPRTWREIAAVGIAVARGIEATHAAGLLHRDVKPDNVLIARDGRTLLTDFGLAKLLSGGADPGAGAGDPPPADAPLADLTATGALLGTPSYMAPEQLHGDAIDVRSDQFAFCVSLYEALTGERPFRGRTISELVASLEQGARWPRRAPRVPAGVRKVILRGLSIDRDQRYRSMTELAGALERAARAPRRRLLAAVASLAVLGTVGGVFLLPHRSPVTAVRDAAQSTINAAWSSRRRAAVRAAILATGADSAPETEKLIERNLDQYSRRWLDARVDAWSATHVREEQTEEALERRLACYGRLALGLDALTEVLARTSSPGELQRALKATYSLTPVETCADPLLVGYGAHKDDPRIGQLERQLARVAALYATGHLDDALALARTVVAATDELGVPELSARALFELGLNQGDSSHPADAEATFRRTIQEAARAQDHVLVARTWHRLMELLGSYLDRTTEALALEPVARAAIAQAGGDPMQYGMLDLTLGELHLAHGDLTRAEGELVRAEKEFTTARGPTHVSHVIALSTLGAVLTTEGKLDQADATLRKALALSRTLLGQKSIDYGLLLQRLSSLAKRRKAWSEVESYSRRAIDVMIHAGGADNPRVAGARLLLVDALEQRGALDEADHQIALTETAFRKSLPAGHPNITRAQLRRAQLAERRKHYDVAVKLADQAVADTRVSTLKNDRFFAFVLAEDARMTAYQHPREALPIYDEALTLWTSYENRDRSQDAATLDELAVVALRAGRPAAALAWFARMPRAAKELTARRRQLEAAARHRKKN